MAPKGTQRPFGGCPILTPGHMEPVSVRFHVGLLSGVLLPKSEGFDLTWDKKYLHSFPDVSRRCLVKSKGLVEPGLPRDFLKSRPKRQYRPSATGPLVCEVVGYLG